VTRLETDGAGRPTGEPHARRSGWAEGGTGGHPWRLGRYPLLMPRRVEEILLVSSPYDSFILEEDGLLTELIYSEYSDLGLSHAPNVTRAPTGGEALAMVGEKRVDLVIAMSRLGDMQVEDFREALHALAPDVPLAILLSSELELEKFTDRVSTFDPSNIFVWHGDAKLFVAMIKSLEDRWNAAHDTQAAGVGVIVVIEDSVQFRSALLPIIYSELVKQSRAVLAEGINRMHKQLRMRARPKVLVADTYERGMAYYERYRPYLFGVIADVRFPRGGQADAQAGIDFIREVRADNPDLPTLLQSSDFSNRRLAEAVGTHFLHKHSPTLLQEISQFMLAHFGFGDFVFRLPDGQEVARASDLRGMMHVLQRVPAASIEYHAARNHFSNWLRARTEFELANSLRPWQVTEFADMEVLRQRLIAACRQALARNRRGLIEDFARQRFDADSRFARIGGGSLGGKARGLAFVDAMIARHGLEQRYPDVEIMVPRTVVIGTDVFDAFLARNELSGILHAGLSDTDIRQAFLRAAFPAEIEADLRAFLEVVSVPVAVRSSSLLEDSQHYPFAGVYGTYMLPNNEPELALRLERLSQAIKLVYASTFYNAARRYMDNTPYRIEEQKMGVVLQPVVGRQRGDYFYPSLAGDARSFNHYPFGPSRAEEGVANVALGLGSFVMDGGAALRFSPAHPEVLPQLSEPEAFLNQSQRTFRAIALVPERDTPAAPSFQNTVDLDLSVAEEHGTLAPVASVWSPENQAFYDGLHQPGVRAVTFAHVLKYNVFPLAQLLTDLLEIGKAGMNAPVDIEFACNLDRTPKQFALLQIRPCALGGDGGEVRIGAVADAELICRSDCALGHGIVSGITDLVYVRPERFDAQRTEAIAAEIGSLNDALMDAGRHCMLVGPGRWGSSTRWLGIPVTWPQICSARIMVETSLDDFVVDPSQGSHFFHNLTAFRIAYLSVNATAGCGFIDWDWLQVQPAVAETDYVRHLRLPLPVEAQVDGRTSTGVVLKRSRRVTQAEGVG
jgi:hypothetical protein